MTVKELIEILREENPESLVVLSKDAEGNSYRILAETESGQFLPDHYGASFGDYYDNLEYVQYAVKAVFLWPR